MNNELYSAQKSSILKRIADQLLLWLFLITPLIAIADGETPTEAAVQPPPMPVTVAYPEQRVITEWDEYTGRFEAFQWVEIRARVSGYLQSIHFRDGQFVKQGDLLFTIDPRPFEAAIEAAKAELSRAETQYSLAAQELNRAKRLVAKKAMSQEEVDARNSSMKTSQASIAAARAAIRSAELDLEYSRISAPISGRISSRKIDIGNLIQLGGIQILTTIVTQEPVYFVFDVSESDYLKYMRLHSATGDLTMMKASLQVEVRLLDENEFMHRGQVDFVDTQLDESTGTIRIRAIFENNANGLLLPGIFGRVRLPAGAPAAALLIPDAAILSDMSNKMVMTVDDQGKVVPKKVGLGPIIEGMRVIRSGLNQQDRVITEGLLRARPGATVAPHEHKPQTGAAGADNSQ